MELKYRDIMIKEAHKGGSVVIMSAKRYCKMDYDNLNDNKTYKKLIAPVTTR